MAGAKRRPGALVAIAAALVLFVTLERSRCVAACATGAAHRHLVILGRSKERSDAAQTLGSMPLLLRSAAVQNTAPRALRRLATILHRLDPSAGVTAWILGSALRFASLRPRMTKAWRLRPH
ncbi:hypothetical protein MPLDJ20_280014 [Mesorhizobium plurifarium]|uniref:Uncharacterized protein n=1 Tax=Mesorhizobium plurifarium TaxID=69974 RepID=A0A090F9M6_MESPL|nr:hypothetical protein MPLDJ20_280014 [Mesorhizobium plurifarium]